MLTAHPDDECMFFGPIIQSLVQHGVTVSALCLSEGNAEGFGRVRAQELTRSYGVLGVPRDRVTCLDDAALQDGMDLSLIHISEPTRRLRGSRMPSSA